jgi:ribosomal protein L16 Arg81 hydroxylase
MRRTLEAAVTGAGAEEFQVWLGTLLSEPKLHLQLVPPDPPWGRERVLEALTAYGRLERDGRSRLLFSAPAAPGQPARLYANGVAHRAPPPLLGFLSLLANRRVLARDEAGPWLARPEAAELLAALFNAGHFLPPGGGGQPSAAAP